MGTSYVHGWHEQYRNVHLFSPYIHRCDSKRHKGVQLGCNAVQRLDSIGSSASLYACVHYAIQHRRVDRINARCSLSEYSCHRYIFCCRSFSLCHVWRDGLCSLWRAVLLVSENVRQDVHKTPCVHRLALDDCWVQYSIFSDAHIRIYGYAAKVLPLPSSV